MQKNEITNYVVKALGKHQTQNNIVQYLCENAGMTWTEAEKLVKQIQARHGSEIRNQQSPLIIAIGIFSFFAGWGLIAYGVYYFFYFLEQDAVQMARNSRSLLFAIGAPITGLGLVIGSIVGTWNQIKSIFEDKEHR